MTVRTRVHTISPPMVLISSAAGRTTSDRRRVAIRSDGDIYIGGPDVDADTGLFLRQGDRFEVDQSLNDDIYVMPATATTQVTTLETRAAAFGYQISHYPPLGPKFGDIWEGSNGDTAQFSAEGEWVALEPVEGNALPLLGNSQLWIGPT